VSKIKGWARVYLETAHSFDYSIFVYPTEGQAKEIFGRDDKERKNLMAVVPFEYEVAVG
jgi:hypothetical protein